MFPTPGYTPLGSLLRDSAQGYLVGRPITTSAARTVAIAQGEKSNGGRSQPLDIWERYFNRVNP